MRVRSSEALWKEGGGYYTDGEEELRRRPVLPNLKGFRDQRLLRVFEQYGNCAAGSRVFEVGCGRSAWLAYLGQKGCSVFGVDIEPFAAQLAKANLAGAGARGEVLCRDAFDLEANRDLFERFDLVYSQGVLEHFDDPARRLAILGKYVAPGGRILTTVPNLQGVNSFLQRFADRERFEMHVVYDSKKLAQVHEDAGFETIASGYVGFVDGYLSAGRESTGDTRRRIHHYLCRTLGLASEAWCRTVGTISAPELSWLAPHVFYAGRRPSRTGR